MANKIILKKSSVAAKTPLATDLEVGELAVNLADQKLYTKDAGGNVILVGSGAGGSGAVSSVAGKTGAVTLVVGDVSGAQPSATAITTSNISSQSVNYAATAGSADNIDGVAFKNATNGASFDADSTAINGIGYSTGYSLFGQTDGGIYSSTHSSAWQHQINGDFRTGQIAIRGKNSGTWQAWRTVLDSGNYTGYSPSLTGGGASGTWGINITGSAGSAPANGGTATALNSSNYISRTGSSGNLNTDFSNTPAGSIRFQGDDANLANSPGGTWWHYQHLRHSNASNIWGTQVAWGWEDQSNRLCTRNVSGGSWSGWVEYLSTSGRSFSGSLTMTGNVTAYSDERLKTDWKPMQSDFVYQLSKVKSGSYTRTDTKERQAGVSAQGIQKIIPEAVFEDDKGNLSLAYGNAAMVSCVELAKVIEELRAEIAEMKASLGK